MLSVDVSLHHIQGSEPHGTDIAGELVVTNPPLVVLPQGLSTEHPPATEITASLVAETKRLNGIE